MLRILNDWDDGCVLDVGVVVGCGSLAPPVPSPSPPALSPGGERGVLGERGDCSRWRFWLGIGGVGERGGFVLGSFVLRRALGGSQTRPYHRSGAWAVHERPLRGAFSFLVGVVVVWGVLAPPFRPCLLTPALSPGGDLCETCMDGYCWRLSSRDPPLSFGHFPRERGKPGRPAPPLGSRVRIGVRARLRGNDVEVCGGFCGESVVLRRGAGRVTDPPLPAGCVLGLFVRK